MRRILRLARDASRKALPAVSLFLLSVFWLPLTLRGVVAVATVFLLVSGSIFLALWGSRRLWENLYMAVSSILGYTASISLLSVSGLGATSPAGLLLTILLAFSLVPEGILREKWGVCVGSLPPARVVLLDELYKARAKIEDGRLCGAKYHLLMSGAGFDGEAIVILGDSEVEATVRSVLWLLKNHTPVRLLLEGGEKSRILTPQELLLFIARKRNLGVVAEVCRLIKKRKSLLRKNIGALGGCTHISGGRAPLWLPYHVAVGSGDCLEDVCYVILKPL